MKTLYSLIALLFIATYSLHAQEKKTLYQLDANAQLHDDGSIYHSGVGFAAVLIILFLLRLTWDPLWLPILYLPAIHRGHTTRYLLGSQHYGFPKNCLTVLFRPHFGVQCVLKQD
jgi:hypothetical protein